LDIATKTASNVPSNTALQCNQHVMQGFVIGHGLMLLLSIAKWPDSLTSQLLVYGGDRQAPLDLLNLLPEGTNLDPDTWLMCHMLIRAFLRGIANPSNIQQKIFLKELVHIY
jgi:hypothetical protein